MLTQCPDQSYCCGDQNTTCCNEVNDVWIRNGEPTRTNPTTTQPAISATTSSTASAAPLPAPAPFAPKRDGLSKGAIAETVVGAIAIVAILGLVTWLLMRRRTRQRTDEKTPDVAEEPEVVQFAEIEGNSTFPHLRDQKGALMELPAEKKGGKPKVELVGDVDLDGRGNTTVRTHGQYDLLSRVEMTVL